MKRRWRWRLPCLLALALTLGLTTPAGAYQKDSYYVSDDGWVIELLDGKGSLAGYLGPGGDVTVPAQVEGIPVAFLGSGVLFHQGDGSLGGDSIWPEDYNGGANVTSYAVEGGDTPFYARDGVLFQRAGTPLWGGIVTGEDELAAYPKASPRASYTVPEGIEYIGECTFSGAKYLESVTIPASCLQIAPDAFRDCAALREVIFQGGKREGAMSVSGFQGCTGLTTFVIPDAEEDRGYIEVDAFRGCTGLTTLVVPSCVTGVSDGNPFAGCDSLTIYGEEGSYIQRWCRLNNLPFRVVDSCDSYAAALRTGQTEPPAPQAGAGEPSAWARSEVMSARAADLIPAALDGAYQAPITRGEFAVLACAYADAVGAKGGGRTVSFPDTSDPAVLRAAGMGVITGYADGTFGPERSIRRDEAAAMLARCARLAGETPNLPGRPFSDAGSFGAWAREDISFVSRCVVPTSANAVMNGVNAAEFGPAGSYTREQAFSTFYRLWLYHDRPDYELRGDCFQVRLTRELTVTVDGTALVVSGLPAGRAASLSAIGPDPQYGKTSGESVYTFDLSAAQNGVYDIWLDVGDGGPYAALPGRTLPSVPGRVLDDPQADTLDQYNPGKLAKLSNVLAFIPTPVFDLNEEVHAGYTPPTGGDYLRSSDTIRPDDPQVRALAAEITAGLTDDYDKLLAIHDWIIANIAYDHEGARTGSAFSQGGSGDDPQSVPVILRTGQAVCEGYTRLTASLCRAVGIPAKNVRGATCALSGGWDVDWAGYAFIRDPDDGIYAGITHAWNEVWVDGRWVIVDTTWDRIDMSFYTGEGGVVLTHAYFDPDLWTFSADHLIVYVDEETGIESEQ